MLHFTMPWAAALRLRAFGKIGLICVSGFIASLQPSRIQAWYFAIAVLLYIAVSSWTNYRKIWVSISSKGLHGKSIFFQPFVVPWTSAIMLSKIAATFQGRPAGTTLLEVGTDGIPKFNTIFLPLTIITTAEFKSALAKYAPTNHPILALLDAT